MCYRQSRHVWAAHLSIRTQSGTHLLNISKVSSSQKNKEAFPRERPENITTFLTVTAGLQKLWELYFPQDRKALTPPPPLHPQCWELAVLCLSFGFTMIVGNRNSRP